MQPRVLHPSRIIQTKLACPADKLSESRVLFRNIVEYLTVFESHKGDIDHEVVEFHAACVAWLPSTLRVKDRLVQDDVQASVVSPNLEHDTFA